MPVDLLFVGTGAADYETPFTCECPNCTAIRQRGGRNQRHYASLLVDGRILLDCGPTVPWRLAELEVAPAQVEALVFTHSHEDHVDAAAVADLLQARPTDRGPLPVFANAATLAVLEGLSARLQVTEVTPGQEVVVLDRRCVPLPATHSAAPGERTLNWLLSDGDGWLLYATDTSWWRPEAWDLLASHRLSAAIVEATFGLATEADLPPGYLTVHHNWHSFLQVRGELIARGLLAPEAPYLSTHISQHFAPPHDELCASARPPVVLSYDGLRVTL